MESMNCRPILIDLESDMKNIPKIELEDTLSLNNSIATSTDDDFPLPNKTITEGIKFKSRFIKKRRLDALLRTENLDRTKLKMMDLIYLNGTQQPIEKKPKSEVIVEDAANCLMIKSEKSNRSTSEIADMKSETTKTHNMDSHNTVNKASPNEEGPATEIPVAQLKLNSNGEIVIDNESMNFVTSAEKRARDFMANSKVVMLDENSPRPNYHKRPVRGRDWYLEETMKFYRCLQTLGTDFSMMTPYFPGRSRRSLKLKFKREERLNPQLVDRAILNPREFDVDCLKAHLDKYEEELQVRLERKAQEEEERKNQKRFKKDKTCIPVTSAADRVLNGFNIYDEDVTSNAANTLAVFNNLPTKAKRKCKPRVLKCKKPQNLQSECILDPDNTPSEPLSGASGKRKRKEALVKLTPSTEDVHVDIKTNTTSEESNNNLHNYCGGDDNDVPKEETKKNTGRKKKATAKGKKTENNDNSDNYHEGGDDNNVPKEETKKNTGRKKKATAKGKKTDSNDNNSDNYHGGDDNNVPREEIKKNTVRKRKTTAKIKKTNDNDNNSANCCGGQGRGGKEKKKMEKNNIKTARGKNKDSDNLMTPVKSTLSSEDIHRDVMADTKTEENDNNLDGYYIDDQSHHHDYLHSLENRCDDASVIYDDTLILESLFNASIAEQELDEDILTRPSTINIIDHKKYSVDEDSHNNMTFILAPDLELDRMEINRDPINDTYVADDTGLAALKRDLTVLSASLPSMQGQIIKIEDDDER